MVRLGSKLGWVRFDGRLGGIQVLVEGERIARAITGNAKQREATQDGGGDPELETGDESINRQALFLCRTAVCRTLCPR